MCLARLRRSYRAAAPEQLETQGARSARDLLDGERRRVETAQVTLLGVLVSPTDATDIRRYDEAAVASGRKRAPDEHRPIRPSEYVLARSDV